MYDIGDIICVLPYDEVPDTWGLSKRQWEQMVDRPIEIIAKDDLEYYIWYYKNNK